MILTKLKIAINELEQQKQTFLGNLENLCWRDDRQHTTIPETHTKLLDFVISDTYVMGELVPLPVTSHREYQQWFSSVRVIISKNQPDRLPEIDELYESIKQILKNSHVSKQSFFNLKDSIDLQFDLLSATVNYIYYSIYDIELEAYSIIMDDELLAAQHLLSKGFFRPAGVLAGVILERHLKNLMRKHTPPVTFKENALLSTLNDACKDSSIYDLITWRKIQHLADIRNKCAHDKISEPTRQEVGDLISGVSGILKMFTA
jgi:hypothetical protein